MTDVPIDRVQLALLTFELQQSLAHAQYRGGTSGRPVQAPQQLLSGRLGDPAKPREVGCRGIRRVRLRGVEHLLWIGREFGEQPQEKLLLIFFVELAIKVESGLRQRYARRLATLRQ